jgi:hypothetical protein
MVRNGRDPLKEREEQKAQAEADEAKPTAGGMSFREVARMYGDQDHPAVVARETRSRIAVARTHREHSRLCAGEGLA